VGLSRKFNLTLEVVSEQINQSENELIKDHISVLPGRFCQYAPVGKASVADYPDQAFYHVCGAETVFLSQFPEVEFQKRC
jgi:hypothetical protein